MAQSSPVVAELAGVVAVVLTFRRPQLASDVVESLRDVEGVDPSRIFVVVNGEGGLRDGRLEDTVRMVRLPENLGPAGGFREGLVAAFADPSTRWAYLCEDDVGLFDLPSPRLARVVAAAEGWEERSSTPIGAVVAYGRRAARRAGGTDPYVPGAASPLEPVDTAAWGATLVSRRVVDAGVLPDAEWFFGYEDFDFYLKLREAGFALLVDGVSARAVAAQMTSAGRDEALRARRPTDQQEPWRAYYVARNFVALARRHGDWRWLGWHLLYSLRRMQLAASWAERGATAHGLWDGARGRLGRNPRYGRDTGEYS